MTAKTRFDIKESEKRIKRFWEKEKIYKFDVKRKGSIFSIDTPPPTVSGAMHIGHSFSYAQQDFIARFRRMFENVFYPFGTDDNGLPTEKLIENLKEAISLKSNTQYFSLETFNILSEYIHNYNQGLYEN